MRKEDITIIICCAGMGTRLGIGSTKALVDIEGKPLIVRLLELLKGYDDIRIVVGFQAERVIETVTSVRKDVIFVLNHEYATTGIAYSFQLALKNCRKYIVEIDGDLLIDSFDFDNFMSYPDECIGITDINSDDPILVNVNKDMVTCLSKTQGNAEWTGLFKVESSKINGTAQYIYELIKKILPLPAIYIGARDIDTADDYEKAIKWYVENKKEESNIE